jgi:hypothetical protein
MEYSTNHRFGPLVLCSTSSYVYVWQILVLVLLRLENVLLTAGKKVIRRPQRSESDPLGPSYDLSFLGSQPRAGAFV